MLREMDNIEWLGWQIFDELEPIGEERGDFRTAHIVQTVINIGQRLVAMLAALAGVRTPPVAETTIEDCMLSLGDRLATIKAEKDARQKPEEIESYLTAWFDGLNQRFKK